MAWSNSKIFRAYVADIIGNTTSMDLNTDASIKVSLHNNTITPDQNVTSANSAFNAGVWTTTNEVIDATDLAGGGTVTISGAYGCLVYDDTIATPVADQGICFNYFGGSQSVTAGTFTIVWNANGIFRITL